MSCPTSSTRVLCATQVPSTSSLIIALAFSSTSPDLARRDGLDHAGCRRS